MGRRGRKLFLAVVVAKHMKVAALYRQVELVVLAYASEKLQTGRARRAGIRFGKVRDPRTRRAPPP